MRQEISYATSLGYEQKKKTSPFSLSVSFMSRSFGDMAHINPLDRSDRGSHKWNHMRNWNPPCSFFIFLSLSLSSPYIRASYIAQLIFMYVCIIFAFQIAIRVYWTGCNGPSHLYRIIDRHISKPERRQIGYPVKHTKIQNLKKKKMHQLEMRSASFYTCIWRRLWRHKTTRLVQGSTLN